MVQFGFKRLRLMIHRVVSQVIRGILVRPELELICLSKLAFAVLLPRGTSGFNSR